LDQNRYRHLISTTGGGIAECLLRGLLLGVSVVYRAVVVLRNFCYDRKLLKSKKAGAAVISVGNVTTGGTGKTPLVIWLCGLLAKKGISCAILTRGYKGIEGGMGDEPTILAKACPQAKVVVNPDRLSGAAKAIREYGAKVLVMDDGFQHRRLRRDIDIVAVDAMCPFGYGRVLPAGLLREPVKGLQRANAVVITRYDQVDEERIAELEKQISLIAPAAVVAKAVHKHTCAKGVKGATFSIEGLKEKRIFAFMGIGNPAGFLNRLDEHGFNVIGNRIYNDHYNYTEADVKDIHTQAEQAGADMVLATEKDWVKTALLWQEKNTIALAYLALELQFVTGAEELKALIEKTLK